MTVCVIDYKMGNLGSVKRSFEECGATVVVSEDPKDLSQASHVVLPGVGAFSVGMAHLREQGWVSRIREAVELGVPLLGICLGMQLLAERGHEGGLAEGLGFIAGEVLRLNPGVEPNSERVRIPHVGWNEVYPTYPSLLFDGVASGTDFYFVHSYHLAASNDRSVIASTPYCGNFASAVMKDNVFGVQFHPEKSSKPGFQLLRNFLKT